jgi:hypothetical protein
MKELTQTGGSPVKVFASTFGNMVKIDAFLWKWKLQKLM